MAIQTSHALFGMGATTTLFLLYIYHIENRQSDGWGQESSFILARMQKFNNESMKRMNDKMEENMRDFILLKNQMQQTIDKYDNQPTLSSNLALKNYDQNSSLLSSINDLSQETK